MQVTPNGEKIVCPYPTTHAALFLETCSKQAAATVQTEAVQKLQAEVNALSAEIEALPLVDSSSAHKGDLMRRRSAVQSAIDNYKTIDGSFALMRPYPIVICDTMQQATALRQGCMGKDEHLFVISQDSLFKTLAGCVSVRDLPDAGLEQHQVRSILALTLNYCTLLCRNPPD